MISNDARQPAGGFGRLITLVSLIAAPLLLVGCPDGPTSTRNASRVITRPTPTPAPTPIAVWWVDAEINIADIQSCRAIGKENSFQVHVSVSNVRSGIGGFSFSLHFDDRYVEFTNAEAVDHLLTSAGGTLKEFGWVLSDAQTVMVTATRQQSASPTSGDGILARLTFKVKAPRGQTGLDIDPAQLLDPNGTPIPSEFSPAKAQVVIDSTASSSCWMVNLRRDAQGSSPGNVEDFSPGDGICDSNGELGIVECSLQAAIQEANEIPGWNRIGFFPILDDGIAATLPFTISLTSPLPAFTDAAGITIDGTIRNEEGKPRRGIIMRWAAANQDGVGFRIESPNTTICGVDFDGFPGPAVIISSDKAIGEGKIVYSGDC